jgi:hypothetical protein
MPESASGQSRRYLRCLAGPVYILHITHVYMYRNVVSKKPGTLKGHKRLAGVYMSTGFWDDSTS